MHRVIRHLCLPLLALIAVLSLPETASAANCGPNTKIMVIEKYGLVPDLQYICSGQTVVIYNRSGTDISFKYVDRYGRQYSTPRIRYGYTITLDAATSLWDVRTYGLWSNYYLMSAEIRNGTAPDSY